MATKKKMNEEVQAPEVGMTTEQTMEQTVPEREEEHVEEAREQTPETMEATEAPADTEKDVASAKKNVGSALESLSVLADRHRVPSWQQALTDAMEEYPGIATSFATAIIKGVGISAELGN